MQIKNGKGEVSLTPNGRLKEEKANKFKGKKFTNLTRTEKDELLLTLCELNGIELK